MHTILLHNKRDWLVGSSAVHKLSASLLHARLAAPYSTRFPLEKAAAGAQMSSTTRTHSIEE